jgi:hypothetical protein
MAKVLINLLASLVVYRAIRAHRQTGQGLANKLVRLLASKY